MKPTIVIVVICLAVGVVALCPARTFINVRVNSDQGGNLHNEEQLVVNPLDSNNVVAVWRDFRLGHRRVGVGYSFDGGLTWHDTLMSENHFPRHSDPGLTVDTDGNFYATILSYTGSTSQPNGLYVQKSTDGGITWGPSIAVVESVPGVFEDKQLIACDRGDSSPHVGNVYCAWARFYATSIMFNRSTDGNQSWDTPITISDGSASRQWPVPAVGPDGTVYCAWCHLSYPNAIRLDRSTDGGASWGSDITVQNVSFGSGYIQPSVMVFSFPALDVDVTDGPYRGNLYIAYMDDAQSGGGTNIWFTKSTDNGTTWSPRLKINDDPDAGKDHFHPWLCVDRNGDITVSWYDRRLDPNNTLMDVYLTQSFDGGDSWTGNVRVSTVSSDPNLFPSDDPPTTEPPTLAGRLGEYNGLWAVSRGRVFAMWADTRDGSPNIYVGFDSTDISALAGSDRGPARPPTRLTATPNPFTNRVALRHPDGPRPVRVYNSAGALVRTLVPPGIWDGRNARGAALPPGVYLAVEPMVPTPLKLIKLR